MPEVLHHVGCDKVGYDIEEHKRSEDPEELAVTALQNWTHFQKERDVESLTRSISQFELLLSKLPINAPGKDEVLSNLGAALYCSYEQHGDQNTLVRAISSHRQALFLRPVGHPEHIASLRELGIALQSLFEVSGNVNALEEAINLHRTVLPLLSTSCTDHGIHYSNLATALVTYAENVEDPDSLFEALELYQKAVTLTSEDHPNYNGHMMNLASTLQSCFEMTGKDTMLVEAINILRQVKNLTGANDPLYGAVLGSLAGGLQLLFDIQRDVHTLDEAILLHRESLAAHPVDHPDRSRVLNNLALSLKSRFDFSTDWESLSEATLMYNEVLSLRPKGHPDRSRALYNLADALHTRFEVARDVPSLHQAITLFRECLELRTLGHPYRSATLSYLGTTLQSLFEETGELTVVEEAIESHQEALLLTPAPHPNRLNRLVNLANTLQVGYDQTGDRDSLTRSIDLYREALSYSARPDELSASMAGLAGTLLKSFSYTSDFAVLSESIDLSRWALKLCLQSTYFHSRSIYFSCLAKALCNKYDHDGDYAALEEGIDNHRQALLYCPREHYKRGNYISNLATSLQKRFDRKGGLDTINQIISLHEDALDACPPGHPHRGGAMENLAAALFRRLQQTGNIEDLSRGISFSREALKICPLSHSYRGNCLLNVAKGLQLRYAYDDDIVSLKEAYQLAREAIGYYSSQNTQFSDAISTLSGILHAYHSVVDDKASFEEAVQLQKRALQSCPDYSPQRRRFLNNLATSIYTYELRYGESLTRTGEILSLLRESIALTPFTHPMRGITLSNLAQALCSCFFDEKLPKSERENALFEALELYNNGLQELQDGHPARLDMYHGTARINLLPNSPHYNISSALDCLSAAIQDSSSSARQRLREAVISMRSLEHVNEHRTCHSAVNRADADGINEAILSLYTQTIALLPRAAHFGLDLAARLRALSGTESMCRAAALHALRLNRLQTAIEILEQAKTVFWAQALRLRFPSLLATIEASATLSEEDRHLQKLLHTLESHSYEGINAKKPETAADLERQIEERRQMNEQVEIVIERIRAQPGRKQFLRVPEYASLIGAASRGPVVVLLAADHHSAALILTTNGALREVELYNVSKRILDDLCARFANSGMGLNRGLGFSQPRKAQPISEAYKALADLWKMVVYPVISALELGKKVGRDRPRIHWCPTGPFSFLPLHAAGVWRATDRGEFVSDYVVSSYTLALEQLIRSREGFQPVNFGDICTLFLAEANAPGQTDLPYVEDEIDKAAQLFDKVTKNENVQVFMSGATDIQAILNSLPQTHIAHFACHGVQHPNALESYFALVSGKLSIASLMRLNLPTATLAFLSACDTARGDSQQPDQALHLAACMLFCGFRSVIATMWTMTDTDGPEIAHHFYRELLQNECLKLDDIPYALDAAVQKLRLRGASPTRWATFIHMGA